MSWINHLPPACWSTFWKSNFKQQLGCRFDIMDNESYFVVFWHMQLYMSWYIRSFFGFTFLNILYFFKYSCTNIFHRRSLYTLYSTGTQTTRKSNTEILQPNSMITISFTQIRFLHKYVIQFHNHLLVRGYMHIMCPHTVYINGYKLIFRKLYFPNEIYHIIHFSTGVF